MTHVNDKLTCSSPTKVAKQKYSRALKPAEQAVEEVIFFFL